MICVPIKKKTPASLIKYLNEAQKKADLVEIWFDEIKLSDENLTEIFAAKKRPFIYKVSKDQQNIENILSQKQKIEYIDIDLGSQKSLIEKVKKVSPKTKIIISFHDFEKTPSDRELDKLAQKILHKGADIIKIATQAKGLSDSLRMLNLLKGLNAKKKKAICICMGKEGELTRATGHLFGNYLMYAPLKPSDKTAPGQIPLAELRKIYGT